MKNKPPRRRQGTGGAILFVWRGSPDTTASLPTFFCRVGVGLDTSAFDGADFGANGEGKLRRPVTSAALRHRVARHFARGGNVSLSNPEARAGPSFQRQGTCLSPGTVEPTSRMTAIQVRIT